MRCQIILLIAILFSINLHAQNVQCGTDLLHADLLANNPADLEKVEKANSILTNQGGIPELLVNGTYYIPVLFHIIHLGDTLGSPLNPVDTAITGYLQRLNQALSATYFAFPDTSNGGQNIQIQLELAQRTPDCQPTTGILRTDGSVVPNYTLHGVRMMSSSVGAWYVDIANLSFSNPQEYLNIYIVNKIEQGAAAGLGFFPSFNPTAGDGVYIDHNDLMYFSPFLAAHEIGHYFGLYHTFTGAVGTTCPSNLNCSLDGDFICDTDPHTLSMQCGDKNAINPCTNTLYGNLATNFMAEAFCGNIFTLGQKQRMLNSLITNRTNLITSLGAQAPSPLSVVPTVDVVPSDGPSCPDSIVSFVAITTNGGSTPNYQWQVNGLNVGTNAANFSYVPTIGDSVNCILTSSNACASITVVNSSAYYVQFIQPVSSTAINLSFQSSYCVGDTLQMAVTLGNLSGDSVIGHEWFINNNLVSTNDTLSSVLSTTVNQIEYWVTFLNNIHCDTATKRVFFRDTITAQPVPVKPLATLTLDTLRSNYLSGQIQWYEVSAGLLVGATTQNYLPGIGGSYYCIATVNGCSSVASDTVLFYPLSLDEIKPNSIIVYPNPSYNGVYNINQVLRGMRYFIYSSQGQLLVQGDVNKKIDISNYAKGVYFLEIEINKNILRRKLIW